MEKLLMRREKRILEMLADAGFEAYFVGGCVRDAMLRGIGDVPDEKDAEADRIGAGGDVDVATNAMPEQVKAVFAHWPVIETGIKHGTVTVVMPSEADAGRCAVPADSDDPVEGPVSVEVTTYRTDGTYTDSRHPDSVQFVRNLTEDLARRDFTINAMACDLRGRVEDPFGGRGDLKDQLIRAVGDPDKRFQEDALRIMRALRFASVLGFAIEPRTEQAMFGNRERLRNVSAERILVEFRKLVCGKAAGDVIRKYVDILAEVIPELTDMKGFAQHNPYHKYDVLEHCIRAMEEVRTTPENAVYMKIAALFHDVGKPQVYTMDEDGIGHFYGHPARSEELVRQILERLKTDRFTVNRVALLVKHHDLIFREDEKLLKKWMNRLTPAVLLEILQIKWADNIATGNMGEELAERFGRIRGMMEEILRQQQCFSLKDLAVSGRDLLDAGVAPGPEVGRVLERLLDSVIEERCANEKETLMAMVESEVLK